MLIFLILLAVYLEIELVFFFLDLKKKQRREKTTLQSLHKLMEARVLNRTLQYRVSPEVATQQEYQQMFIRIEILDSKPWRAQLYATDECITIGRSRENKVSICDDSLSRMHCKIMSYNDALYLQDMGTKNGTIVKNGWLGKIVLPPQGTVVLEDGNIIKIGHYKLRVSIYYGSQIYN